MGGGLDWRRLSGFLPSILLRTAARARRFFPALLGARPCLFPAQRLDIPARDGAIIFLFPRSRPSAARFPEARAARFSSAKTRFFPIRRHLIAAAHLDERLGVHNV